MKKYYIEVINGQITGSPQYWDITDSRCHWPNIKEVVNYDLYNKNTMRIDSIVIQNDKVVYIFKDLWRYSKDNINSQQLKKEISTCEECSLILSTLTNNLNNDNVTYTALQNITDNQKNMIIEKFTNHIPDWSQRQKQQEQMLLAQSMVEALNNWDNLTDIEKFATAKKLIQAYCADNGLI
jgi:hypothetical protein